MAKGKLVLLGSGETAPGMTKVHRELLSGLGEVRAVNLDTPYGFQLNVPQMTQKLVDYFKVSLQTDLKPLSFTNYEKSSGVERELFRQSVREANYVFAGPGSPSYALAQWKGLDLQEDLLHVLDNGGVVCFSSAAALTLGAFTAPIYEIYKAGAEPYWLEGLNLMGLLGINCAVIPHFNNAEGQDYDTSCCYLGLERLESLERELPEDVSTLGVDEHTSLTIDLKAKTLTVAGKGNSYWRRHNESQAINPRSTIEVLNSYSIKTQEKKLQKSIINTTSTQELAQIIERGGNDKLSALAVLLTTADKAGLLSKKLDLIIEVVIKTRNYFRAEGDFAHADELKKELTSLGIRVEDSPTGSSWSYIN